MSSEQQPAEDRDQQDPNPADQQFGKQAAEDPERDDKGDQPEGGNPRAVNKAETDTT